MNNNKKHIFIFVGPSGAGKTTLIERIKNDCGIPNLITHTTRLKREGEIDGVNYHFITEDEFNKLEKVEWAKYSGNYYGLSKKEIDDKLKYNDIVLISQEKNGALKTKSEYGDCVKIVYVYVSPDTMEDRMRLRGDNEKTIIERMNNAITSKEFDNIDIADYVLINENGMLETNVAIFKKIIECLNPKKEDSTTSKRRKKLTIDRLLKIIRK